MKMENIPVEPVSRDSEQYREAYKKMIKMVEDAGMQILYSDTDSVSYREPGGDIVYLHIGEVKTFALAMLCRRCARVPKNCYLARKLPTSCKWFIAPESAVCRKCKKRFVPRQADDQMICLCDGHIVDFCATDSWRSWNIGSRWKKDGDNRRFHDVVYDLVSRWLRETRE